MKDCLLLPHQKIRCFHLRFDFDMRAVCRIMVPLFSDRASSLFPSHLSFEILLILAVSPSWLRHVVFAGPVTAAGNGLPPT